MVQAKNPASLMDDTSGTKRSTREQAEEVVLRTWGPFLKKNSPNVFEKRVKEAEAQLNDNYDKATKWENGTL